MKNKYKNIETKYNGAVWLARDVNISSQYLGDGKTEQEAIKSMEETIQRLKTIKEGEL